MSYRILLPPNGLPNEQHAQYAQAAIAEYEARERQREERRQESRQREERIKADAEETQRRIAEKEKRDEETQRKRAEAMLDADLRASFFAANPSADESDFKRLLPKLRDQFMTERTVNSFEDAKSRLKASGRYAF